MSDLHNPLFDEEKEFLERKKLEYERALRGDVDHLKGQSVMVGKVALVGVGIAGGVWLITKAFGGKKRKRHTGHDETSHHDEVDHDYEFGAEYFTADNGKRYESKTPKKSAADSANAFMAHEAQSHEADDLGFGSTAAQPTASSQRAVIPQHKASAFDTEEFEDDPFQDLPYDDSRRLPASRAFDKVRTPVNSIASSRSKMIGAVLQAFLQSDTGKVIVAQVAAVVMAVVTKKLSEFFPADKNTDLATSPGYAPAESGLSPVASTASPDSSDASTHPQSI